MGVAAVWIVPKGPGPELVFLGWVIFGVAPISLDNDGAFALSSTNIAMPVIPTTRSPCAPSTTSFWALHRLHGICL